MSQHPGEGGPQAAGVEVLIRMANILFGLVMAQNLTVVAEVWMGVQGPLMLTCAFLSLSLLVFECDF